MPSVLFFLFPLLFCLSPFSNFSFKGLNTIREMCVRAPLIMPEGLLKDLCSYKRHRDKGIMMSSKSIISLFRTINPGLLPKKERVSFLLFLSSF